MLLLFGASVLLFSGLLTWIFYRILSAPPYPPNLPKGSLVRLNPLVRIRGKLYRRRITTIYKIIDSEVYGTKKNPSWTLTLIATSDPSRIVHVPHTEVELITTFDVEPPPGAS